MTMRLRMNATLAKMKCPNRGIGTRSVGSIPLGDSVMLPILTVFEDYSIYHGDVALQDRQVHALIS